MQNTPVAEILARRDSFRAFVASRAGDADAEDILQDRLVTALR